MFRNRYERRPPPKDRRPDPSYSVKDYPEIMDARWQHQHMADVQAGAPLDVVELRAVTERLKVHSYPCPLTVSGYSEERIEEFIKRYKDRGDLGWEEEPIEKMLVVNVDFDSNNQAVISRITTRQRH